VNVLVTFSADKQNVDSARHTLLHSRLDYPQLPKSSRTPGLMLLVATRASQHVPQPVSSISHCHDVYKRFPHRNSVTLPSSISSTRPTHCNALMQWHTTVGKSPLYEGSARRRDLYLTTHTTLTGDRHLCLRRDSNPQSQQTIGLRPLPLKKCNIQIHHWVMWDITTKLEFKLYDMMRFLSTFYRGLLFTIKKINLFTNKQFMSNE
jgi:hypothetical protein